MAKQFSLDGIGDKVEFGKDGHYLDMSNGHAEFDDHSGNPIEVRGAQATHSSAFVTKGQLDSATGSDAGTIWIEYGTKPSLTNFSANTRKEFDLTGGTATLLSDYSVIPSGTSWNGSDARTYIIDVTNGLITPNNVDKQPVVISVELDYVDLGSGTNTDVGLLLDLVEFNGSTENLTIRKQFKKSNNDSGDGNVTVDFMTNVTSHVNGSGKGWRLYAKSLEADSNAVIRIKRIRQRCG